MSAWNTDVAILNEQALFCDAFEVGEVVEYNNAEYYVLKDSSTSDDYVTLLKKDPLNASEVNQYSDSYVSQNGEYPYYESDTCNELTQTGCSTNYDTSSVKKIVDGWSSSFSDDLVSIDGYKTRLIGENDFSFYIYDSFGNIEIRTDMPSSLGSEEKSWTTAIVDDSSNSVISIIFGPYVEKIYDKVYIRPVINVKKKAIDNICSLNERYLKYKIGETISYNNNDYCVIENSLATQDYVTLIKQLPLTYDELLAYKGDLSTDYFQNSNGRGLSYYYKSNLCYRKNESDYNFSGCTNNYDTSFVKTVINNWSNSILNDLKEVDGYKVRLLNIDELFENLGYDRNIRGTADQYIKTINVPSCLYNVGSYWTMSGLDDDNINMYIINNSGMIDGNRWNNATAGGKAVFYQYAVRPVINLKKCAIDNTCE